MYRNTPSTSLTKGYMLYNIPVSLLFELFELTWWTCVYLLCLDYVGGIFYRTFIDTLFNIHTTHGGHHSAPQTGKSLTGCQRIICCHVPGIW